MGIAVQGGVGGAMGIDSCLTDALLREPGQALDRTTRDAMETGLRADFGDVVVHTSSLSARANDLLGSRAFTIRNHIFLARGDARPWTAQGRRLLAHELAHVVQKRLGGAGACGWTHARAAEAEAHAAATMVMQGGRYRCTIPLPPDTPSCWAEAGHYYTVNFVLQAAGLDPAQAGQIAFFAQMGDEVVELDAVEQGKKWVEMQAGMSALGVVGRFAAAPLKERMRVAMEIGSGLHCLTGADSTRETGWRASILEKAEVGDDNLKLGLAIHAFGDSYAHRDISAGGKTMYPPIIGHAKIMATEAMGGKMPSRAHAEIPDHIDGRPELYREYGRELYAIARYRWKTPLARGISLGTLTHALDEVSVKGDDNQILKIRSLSARLCHAIDRRYFPELRIPDGDDYKDCVSYERFMAIHKLPPTFLQRARGYARAWSHLSGSPAPGRQSKVSDYDIVETPATAVRSEPIKTHIVKGGESLSLIARQHYGTTERWPAIWKANRGVIGNNPNFIKPGVTLVLP